MGKEIIYSDRKDTGRTVQWNGFWKEILAYILGGHWVVVNDTCSVDRVIWRWHWLGGGRWPEVKCGNIVSKHIQESNGRQGKR